MAVQQGHYRFAMRAPQAQILIAPQIEEHKVIVCNTIEGVLG
jgi:hypothetical protein